MDVLYQVLALLLMTLPMLFVVVIDWCIATDISQWQSVDGVADYSKTTTRGVSRVYPFNTECIVPGTGA